MTCGGSGGGGGCCCTVTCRDRSRGAAWKSGRGARPFHGHDVVGEGDVGSAARLQGNGMRAEVLQHVENGLEPQVLHTTLAVVVNV